MSWGESTGQVHVVSSLPAVTKQGHRGGSYPGH